MRIFERYSQPSTANFCFLRFTVTPVSPSLNSASPDCKTVGISLVARPPELQIERYGPFTIRGILRIIEPHPRVSHDPQLRAVSRLVHAVVIFRPREISITQLFSKLFFSFASYYQRRVDKSIRFFKLEGKKRKNKSIKLIEDRFLQVTLIIAH